jgi:hypothetical protein
MECLVQVLRDGAAWYDPLGWLAGYLGDQVVVAVVVQDGDALSFGDRGDEQVGEADCPDLPAAPQRGLHVQGPVPVLVVRGQPFVAGVPVSSRFIEFGGGSGCPAQFELEDAAGRDQTGLDQRPERCGDCGVTQPG